MGSFPKGPWCISQPHEDILGEQGVPNCPRHLYVGNWDVVLISAVCEVTIDRVTPDYSRVSISTISLGYLSLGVLIWELRPALPPG